MRTRKQLIASVLAVTLCSATALYADSAAELLEKGIYNEDTIGNLDEAIKIYREVVTAAKETEAVAAQAQYRLGQCLLKKGNKNEATAAFQALLKNYPNQKGLVAKAKKHLPGELRFQPAPWKTGERLTLEMKLAGGQTIGIVGLGVDAGKAEGKEVWNMTVRRFVSAGQNEGVSRIIVDKSSNRPLRTAWDHTVLGRSSAEWHDDKLAITTKANDGKVDIKTVDFDETAYSNDQWFYGFRQLPLKVGYKVTIPIRVAFTGGSPIGLELTVDKKETVKTPAGSFECFRLDTNIAQTFWIADVPERYPAKFEAGGVIALMSSVDSGEAPKKLENDKLGFSLTVPQGWFYHSLSTSNEDTSGGVRLVAPDMASVMVRVRDTSLLDPDERESLQAWAESRIKGAKRAYKDFDLRAGSMRDIQLAGATAKTFLIDQEISSRKFVRGNTLAMVRDKSIDVGTTALKEQFDSHREQFDALQNSITLR